jgi:hypothetical protein
MDGAHAVDGHISWDGHGAACCEGHEGMGLSLWGDLLYLHARRNDLDFAVLNNTGSSAIPGGSIESLDWATNAGFRLGAGWTLPNSAWQIGLTYTYFHSNDNRGLAAPANGSLFATLPRAGTIDTVDSAVGSTSLDYQVVDLDLSRKFHPCNDLVLTVFGGGRFAYIDEKEKAVYNGAGAMNYEVSSPVLFRGAGLSVGGEGFWDMYRGAGIYARTRLGLVSGEFRNLHTEVNNAGGPGALGVVDVSEKTYAVLPVTEISMGLAYRANNMNLSIGYELTNWFGMVNSPDFIDPTAAGKLTRRTSDLSLEGLAVRLGLEY